MSARRGWVLAGLLAPMLAAGASVGTVRHLELVSAAGRVTWMGPIAAGEAFDLRFVHSHERCLWTQHYRTGDDGAIEQTGSTFPCFGAGMPAGSTDGSPVVRTRDGYLVAAPARIGELQMINSKDAEITLLWRNQQVPISHLFDDFQRFSMRVR
jgi:hypothetical protein